MPTGLPAERLNFKHALRPLESATAPAVGWAPPTRKELADVRKEIAGHLKELGIGSEEITLFHPLWMV